MRDLRPKRRIQPHRRESIPGELALDVEAIARSGEAVARPRFGDLRETLGRKPTLSELDGDWENDNDGR